MENQGLENLNWSMFNAQTIGQEILIDENLLFGVRYKSAQQR